MFSGNAKRIVVIRDIPSNVIEEAILILKNEPGSKDEKDIKDTVHKNKKRDNDFLLKEAEMVINNFMRENRVNAVKPRQNIPKADPKRKKFFTNTVINATLIGSVILLVFLLSRFF